MSGLPPIQTLSSMPNPFTSNPSPLKPVISPQNKPNISPSPIDKPTNENNSPIVPKLSNGMPNPMPMNPTQPKLYPMDQLNQPPILNKQNNQPPNLNKPNNPPILNQLNQPINQNNPPPFVSQQMNPPQLPLNYSYNMNQPGTIRSSITSSFGRPSSFGSFHQLNQPGIYSPSPQFNPFNTHYDPNTYFMNKQLDYLMGPSQLETYIFSLQQQINDLRSLVSQLMIENASSKEIINHLIYLYKQNENRVPRPQPINTFQQNQSNEERMKDQMKSNNGEGSGKNIIKQLTQEDIERAEKNKREKELEELKELEKKFAMQKAKTKKANEEKEQLEKEKKEQEEALKRKQQEEVRRKKEEEERKRKEEERKAEEPKKNEIVAVEKKVLFVEKDNLKDINEEEEELKKQYDALMIQFNQQKEKAEKLCQQFYDEFN